VHIFFRRKPRTLRDVLTDLGLSDADIEEADSAGTTELLAIEGVVLPERGTLTIDELATRVGAEVDTVRAFWRALGFVDVAEGEQLFTRRDVAILRSMLALSDEGLIDQDVALQVARVVGLSMAQIATAVVDASETRARERREEGASDDDPESPAGSLAVRAGDLLPFMSDVIDYAFRRHLRAAARRRVAVVSTIDGAGEVIGFADLVRYSELSLQLDEHELAELIGRFYEIVNRVVIRHGGRIVKMIGDAAMFTIVDPASAALAALELSDAARTDELLSGLRIGMASGPVLARDGDLYGPVVNLASRLGMIGRTGAVNVSQDVRDAIAGDPRFSLRSLGKRSLRHIGNVRVYRLRRGPDWAPIPGTTEADPAIRPAVRR
jgi:adenylate cyclase